MLWGPAPSAAAKTSPDSEAYPSNLPTDGRNRHIAASPPARAHHDQPAGRAHWAGAMTGPPLVGPDPSRAKVPSWLPWARPAMQKSDCTNCAPAGPASCSRHSWPGRSPPNAT